MFKGINNKYVKSFFNILFLVSLIVICSYGICLRFLVFHADTGMFVDEACVVLNIIKRNYLQLISFLDYSQCTPYFLLAFYKFIYNHFGFDELLFKTPAFIFSIINVVLFAYLSCIILKNKFAVILANIMFNLSEALIMYSWIAKQYQSDVFFTILVFLIVLKIKDCKLNYKQIFLLSILSILFILSSYTATFVIATAFIYLLVYKYRNKTLSEDWRKKLLCYIIPLVIFAIPFLIVNCIPTIKDPYLQKFWDKEWIGMFFVPTELDDIKKLFDFLSTGGHLNHFYAIPVCIILSVILMAIKDRFNLLLLATPFVIAIILGLLHLYPFSSSRVSLYLIPIFILLVTKFIDNVDFKKIQLSIIPFIIILFSLYNYTTLSQFIGLAHDFENSFYGYIYGIHRTHVREYINFLCNSDISNNDYIVSDANWASRKMIKLYNKTLFKNRFQDNHIIDNESLEDRIKTLDKIPQNSTLYFFFVNEDYVNDFFNDMLHEWIRCNCRKIYYIETYKGYVRKCYKETPASEPKIYKINKDSKI